MTNKFLKLCVWVITRRSWFSFLRSPVKVETQVLRTQKNLATLYLFYDFCLSHLSNAVKLIEGFDFRNLFLVILLLAYLILINLWLVNHFLINFLQANFFLINFFFVNKIFSGHFLLFFLLNFWHCCTYNNLELLKILEILEVLNVHNLLHRRSYFLWLRLGHYWSKEVLKDVDNFFLSLSKMMVFLVELYDFPQNLQTQIIRKFFFTVEENVHRFQMLFVIAL